MYVKMKPYFSATYEVTLCAMKAHPVLWRHTARWMLYKCMNELRTHKAISVWTTHSVLRRHSARWIVYECMNESRMHKAIRTSHGRTKPSRTHKAITTKARSALRRHTRTYKAISDSFWWHQAIRTSHGRTKPSVYELYDWQLLYFCLSLCT